MPLPSVIMSGRVEQDPATSFTQSGMAQTVLLVMTEHRKPDESGEWRTVAQVGMTVKLWKKPAENAAESLRKGDLVIVYGDLMLDPAGGLYVYGRDVGPSLQFRSTPHSRDAAKAQPQQGELPDAP